MSAPEVLFALLPIEGDWISREAVRVALGERLGADVAEEELDSYVWHLGDRVMPPKHDNNLLRRRLPGDNPVLPLKIECEADLEPWFERFIWKYTRPFFYDPPPQGFNLVVQNTARAGSIGRWTRPDLCAACISRYHYSPNPRFDLFSFELKMPAGCNMLAVHEALAHSASAHFPYLCLYLPAEPGEHAQLPSMLEQAQRHGVGVIVTPQPCDLTSYQLLLVARRHDPPPAKIDGFIDDRFDEANRIALRKWIRS